jgi:2-polyprenyl-3-methyl-5-hydroxy-6-metoxy-1,4-benzoquinol methylase
VDPNGEKNLSGEPRDFISSQQRSPGSIDWDASYRQRDWDYLAGIGETPRYSVVAGYIHKLAPRGHILDAGCGEGVLIDYLDLSRIEYTGFDLSPTAIDRARERYDVAKLVSAPIETFLPPENEQYDVIVFNEVLSQVEHPIKELERFFTFLKPGGHVIISLFQSPRPEARGAIATRMLEAEIAARGIAPAAAAETLNCDAGLRWKIYCLRGVQTDGGAPIKLSGS